ncbi:MAG: dTDP-4-dehydrorhamnose 3,5-epimerase [Acidobacteriales bacterium]|nr:dTDP-4-dehydrorhamnose 3,5-epimerase [Terriglobales bacterium]
MRVTPGKLRGVMILEPRVFSDDRGFFLESFNADVMTEIGIQEEFVQDNHSYSHRNVVRGLHYQVQRAQGKLVRAVAGEILDVVVDLRRSSPTFGKWESVRLSGENRLMLWMPPGFAHGFRVISEGAHVTYKATDTYFPGFERTVAWNDPQLKIDWELKGAPIVSEKDRAGVRFRDAEVYA